VFSGLVAPTGGVDVCGDINLTVTVEHTGPTADITVQVYMQFVNASVPVPRLTLVQFDKLYNVSDGAKSASFELFDTKNDQSTKTGSGQTWENTKRDAIFAGEKRSVTLTVEPERRMIITNETFLR